MRKAFFWFVGTMVLLTIGYATVVANNPNLAHWSISLLLGLLIFAVIGSITTGIIWAIQSYQNKYKKNENKSLQMQNPLSVGELLGLVDAHKCSKCGWGVKVDIFNKIATCPKCGNVDNVSNNSPRLPHIELHITYHKHTIGYAGMGKYKEIKLKEGTLIIDVEADFRPTGQMKIETVELSISGKRLPSLNGEVQNSSEHLWFTQNNIFDLSGISIGSHMLN